MDQEILNQIEEAKVTKKLILSSIDDNSIWDKVLELKDLENLSVHKSNVDYLLKRIDLLSNLKNLDLSNNNIKEIPNNLYMLFNLEDLNLSNNFIEFISKDILNLYNIKNIDLYKSNNLVFYYRISIFGESNLINLYNLIRDSLKTSFNIYLERESFLILNLENVGAQIKFEEKDLFYIVSIIMFGSFQKQKEFILNIRRIIDSIFIENKIIFPTENIKNYREINFFKNNTICTRSYLFQISKPKEEIPPLFILFDYEKLLSYCNSGENLYFDDSTGIKIPVKDLVDYIGINKEDLIETWEGSNYITNLEINDFKLFNDISFNLSENINVILGRNALGKTSILQSITLGLLPLENEDKSNEFRELITFGKDKSEIILHWGNEYRKTYLFKNELNEEKHINIPSKLVLSYGANLNTDEKGIDLEPIISTLITGKDRTYHTKSIFLDYSTNFYDPISILERLYLDKSKNTNESLIGEIIDLIKSFINNYLDLVDGDEKILLEQSNSEFYFKDINNNKIKTRNLSEGFKDHILLITDIIIRVISSRNNLFKDDESISVDKSLLENVSGVILIDEFDRHLHPIWQRKLLSRLKKDFPKIQFILTTHNIFSLQSAEGYKALILSTKENKVIVSEKEIKEGLSIDTIYNEYFGGNSNYFSFEIENLFDKFYLLLKKIKTKQITSEEDDEFKNLIDELSSKSEEVQVIVSRELRQLERQTGKSY